MATPDMISLFRQQQDPSRRPLYFLASIFIHGGVIALLWFGIASIPQINTRVASPHAMVRRIVLKTPDEETQAEEKDAIDYPKIQSTAMDSAAEKHNAQRTASRLAVKSELGRQTLIQPDIADPIKMIDDVPIPMVALWTPNNQPVRVIVAPRHEDAATNTNPSLDQPNKETTLGDVRLAAGSAAEANVPTEASSTSPIEVNKPEQPQQAPQTVTLTDAQPTPASVLSLSELQMRQGTIALPPASESAQTASQGELTTAITEVAEADGSGTASSSNGGRNGDASVAELSARLGEQQSSTSITLPRDGRFSAVILGSSLADQFPDIPASLTRRMAYVVYVHVGLAQSWILQYSLVGEAEAAGGGILHLDAPWPYNIVRPNLTPNSIDSDALMVHGFVNTSGRFESLHIVFPQGFAQAQFLLSALEKWEFRPAMQSGSAVPVEVLLIIPSDVN